MTYSKYSATYFNVLAAFSIVCLLSACVPEKTITQDNVLQILQANSQNNQIRRTVSSSFNAQRNLQRAFSGAGIARTTTNISDTCEGGGDYLFSLSDSSAAFSLLFNDCINHQNRILDGTVDGSFTAVTDNEVSVTLTGNLITESDSGDVILNPLSVDIQLFYEPATLLFSQRGNYLFDTDYFAGVIKVETLEPVGLNLTTGNHFGITTYTDEAKNVLRVEHDNNGVHLYLNDIWFNSFSHSGWLELF